MTMKGLNKLRNKLKKVLPKTLGYTNSGESTSTGQPKILKKKSNEPKTSLVKDRTQCVIGLDFGTSYTKVAISGFENKYIAQLLPRQHILPTRFFIASNGNCTLAETGCIDEIQVSKVKLIEGKARMRDYAVMAAYCALVLKSARDWIIDKESNRLVEYEIDWLLNVGLPTESSESSELTSRYKKIIHAAWRFSSLTNDFALQDVENYLSYDEAPHNIVTNEFSKLDKDCLSLFPEFVGQIQSYIRSPQRQNFAHLLIDVGGGTVDVAVFRVIEDEGEYTYPIYGKSVRTLGAEVLRKKRETMGHKAADVWMKREFKAQISDVITNIPAGRYAEDIHCIFIGGGARLSLYSNALREYQQKQKCFYPLRIIGLEQPTEMLDTQLSKEDFHRVSVAYGLTFEPDDLGLLERGVVTEEVKYHKTENKYLLDPS